jgi:hypothetical protein
MLSPTFPQNPYILAVSSHALWQSRDGGHSWSERSPDSDPGAEVVTPAAPFGFTPDSHVLLGMSDGSIIRKELLRLMVEKVVVDRKGKVRLELRTLSPTSKKFLSGCGAKVGWMQTKQKPM